jgi:hypothetical protein
MPLPPDLLQKMLTAAESAAGAQWKIFSADVTTFAQNLIHDTTQTATDLAAGAITESEAKTQIDAIADESTMIANYADESVKLAAQNALNAATAVLTTAIQAAAHI